MIKYFTIEDLLKHYLQKKFHILSNTGISYITHCVFLSCYTVASMYKGKHALNRVISVIFSVILLQKDTASKKPRKECKAPPMVARLLTGLFLFCG